MVSKCKAYSSGLSAEANLRFLQHEVNRNISIPSLLPGWDASLLQGYNVWFQIHTHLKEGYWKFPGGGEFQKPKLFKGHYELKLEFTKGKEGGEGPNQKKNTMGGVKICILVILNLDRERYCKSKLFCPRTQHNDLCHDLNLVVFDTESSTETDH